MTIGISEQLSLLSSLVTKEARESTGSSSGAKSNDLFAGKLDSILANDTQTSQTELSRSQSLAEALHLQMLQTTLALAGDAPTESPVSQLFNRQPATIQALVKAYSSNLPDSDSQPLHVTESATQLQELSASGTSSGSQPASPE